jgi:hypothetical protein
MLLSIQCLLLMAKEETIDICREILSSFPPDDLYEDEITGIVETYEFIIQDIKVQLLSFPLPVHCLLLQASQDIACTRARGPSPHSRLTVPVNSYKEKSHNAIAYVLQLTRVRMRTALHRVGTSGLCQSRRAFLREWHAVFVAHQLDRNDAYFNLNRDSKIDILDGQFFTPREALKVPTILEDIREDGRNDILDRTVSLMEHDAGIRKPWLTEHLGEADIMGRTSAHVACMRDDSALLDQVMAMDSRMLISVPEWFAISPMEIAVRRGCLDPLVKMKQHDHEEFRKAVFAEPGFGMSVMHWAAESGRANIIRYLLDHLPHLHLDLVYAEDESGRIPLHLAAAGGHMEVVDLLLKVDPSQRNAVDSNHETPFDHATEKGHTQIAKLLESYDESTSSSGDTIDEGDDDATDNGLTLMDFETI